ncbi:MAG: DUF2254 domain-containing protein, partial [Blastochloris sp.]|nr:DUF2254 domain-containing protein [Blastochloris sp.]
MKNRVVLIIDELRSSYWFIPSLLAMLAGLLSIVTIRLDEVVERDLIWVTGLIYVNSPEGARAVLSTIASSMITVAGVVFSLTMVVLSLTSQQYGSLVIRNFIRDRGNQFVLGIFTATFIYCLLILRTIRGLEDDNAFVPHISLLTGLGLAILSLAMLIYFIHHVSESIQASEIIKRISDNLHEAIENWFPSTLGTEQPDEHDEATSLANNMNVNAYPLAAPHSGYIQAIDESVLLKTASKHGLIIALHHRPGTFVIKDSPLAVVTPPQPVSDDIERNIISAFIIEGQRTQPQDVEFIFMQLV